MRSAFDIRLGILLAAAATLLNGCDSGGGSDSKKAQIRLVNVSTGYQSLDLYANKSGDDDKVQTSAVGFETVSDYVKLDSDTYVVKFKRNGITSTLLTLSSEKLTDESHATYIAYGSTGRFATVKIDEDVSDADDGKTKVQLVNLSEAGLVDVYFTDDDVALPDATPQFSQISTSPGTSTIVSGTYRLRVTGTGDTTDLRLDIPSVTLDSKKVTTYILTGTPGGVLVNAVVLPQQSTLSATHNSKARVRAANGISSGTRTSVAIGGLSLLSNQASGVINNKYGQIDAGSVAVALSVDGTPVSIPNQNLAAGGDYTLLLWNDSSGPQMTLVSDDNRLPSTSGNSKIRLMNGISTLGAPISLAVNFSSITGDIDLGMASDYTEVEGGANNTLDVTNANTTDPVIPTQSDVSLQSDSVYTFFVADSGSGQPVGRLRKDR
jgi:hypothetical protein